MQRDTIRHQDIESAAQRPSGTANEEKGAPRPESGERRPLSARLACRRRERMLGESLRAVEARDFARAGDSGYFRLSGIGASA